MRPIAPSIKWKCKVENRFGISNRSLICQPNKTFRRFNVCFSFSQFFAVVFFSPFSLAYSVIEIQRICCRLIDFNPTFKTDTTHISDASQNELMQVFWIVLSMSNQREFQNNLNPFRSKRYVHDNDDDAAFSQIYTLYNDIDFESI